MCDRGTSFDGVDDGLRHTLRVGDGIELDVRDFESVEEGRPMALEGGRCG